MLESNDPDAIPTLDEESLTMRERELLDIGRATARRWLNSTRRRETKGLSR